MIVETIWQLRGNYCIVRCQRRRVNLSWVKMILSSLSLFLCTHRQQVPERNQKKKKKMKWRAERSASSHRFHCAILWPPSSCLLFIIHTHPHTFGCPERNSQQSLTSGAQKWGMGVGGGGVDGSEGRKEKWLWNVGLMSPHNAFEWELCHLSSIIYVPFQRSHISSIISNTELQCHRTVSQSGVIFDFNIKCGTIWLTLREKAKRSRSPWLLELLSSWEREGKGRNRVEMVPCVLQLRQPASHHISILTLPTVSGRKAPVLSLDMLSVFSLCRVDNMRAWRMNVKVVTVILVLKIDVVWCWWVKCQFSECSVHLVAMWCSGFEMSVERGWKNVS